MQLFSFLIGGLMAMSAVPASATYVPASSSALEATSSAQPVQSSISDANSSDCITSAPAGSVVTATTQTSAVLPGTELTLSIQTTGTAEPSSPCTKHHCSSTATSAPDNATSSRSAYHTGTATNGTRGNSTNGTVTRNPSNPVATAGASGLVGSIGATAVVFAAVFWLGFL